MSDVVSFPWPCFEFALRKKIVTSKPENPAACMNLKNAFMKMEGIKLNLSGWKNHVCTAKLYSNRILSLQAKLSCNVS